LEDFPMESSDFSSNETTAGANNAAESNTGSSGMGGSSGMSGSTDQGSGMADRARSALSGAGEKMGDVGSTVRERAGGAKDSLVSALEVGAEKLRARAGDGSLAGAGAMGGSVAIDSDRMTQVTNKVAGGMEAASEWLRDADLNSLKASVETQVKEHPGRTLLIAVGVGYLLGKALRK
jgi:hypothetical protein